MQHSLCFVEKRCIKCNTLFTLINCVAFDATQFVFCKKACCTKCNTLSTLINYVAFDATQFVHCKKALLLFPFNCLEF